jgi:pimeloyl-ACP methyl ester carboxylesterase
VPVAERTDHPIVTTWDDAERRAHRGRITLVHGSGSSSRSWQHVGPALAALGWEVVAVDLPGHGTSRPAGMLEPGGAAEYVRYAVGGTDVALGHSFGAVVASHLAVLGVVERGLVLEEPPGSELVDFDALAEGLEERAAKARTAPLRGLSAALSRLDWSFADVAGAVADVARCDAGWIAAGLRRGAGWDVGNLLAVAALPTLLVLGPDGGGRFDKDEHGSSLRGADRERLLRSTGSVEAVVVGPGHCPHRDDAAGWVEAVDRFAAAVVRSPARSR